MTDNGFELTRRKALAGIGAVGAASVGAGLGTTAYFSDEESFEGNRLVAGELDLMVAWQEHYSDWSTDENDDRTDDFGGDEFDTDLDGDGVDDFDVVMTGGDPANVPSGYVGFPTFDEPLLAVPEDAMDDFLDNTATEAFPDSDGDGIQDVILTRNQIASQNPTLSPEEVEQAFHAQFANVPDDLEAPVIDISDVKPGDFGEVTFNTHLHNNPGYLWINGQLLDASENGLTEPESKDPDEQEGVVELLDEIRAAVWHDDGDNVREQEELINSPHDVEEPTNITLTAQESLITKGTLREVLADLTSGPGIPLDADPTTEERDCYPYSTTFNFGFAWWLPVDHANEIQTDSVTFDLGFYTEQCRHNDGSGQPYELQVWVENVGEGVTVNGEPVVVSPGAFAVHDTDGPIFQVGDPASAGLEDVAEDGDPSTLASELSSASGVSQSGVFNTPVGASGPGPIGPGGAYEFTVEAFPGQQLSFATMFVQSNDLFYAPDPAGIDLVPTEGNPVDGSVTGQVAFWDAGTEDDQAPGAGDNQAPRQSGPDTGPADTNSSTVQRVSDVNAEGYSYPSVSDVVEVTITPQ